MDQELAHQIYLEGELLDASGDLLERLGDNKIAVSYDGKLYVLTIEEVKS